MCVRGYEFTIFSHSIKKLIKTSNLGVTFPSNTDKDFLTDCIKRSQTPPELGLEGVLKIHLIPNGVEARTTSL